MKTSLTFKYGANLNIDVFPPSDDVPVEKWGDEVACRLTMNDGYFEFTRNEMQRFLLTVSVFINGGKQ
jgi:hypothetical protein